MGVDLTLLPLHPEPDPEDYDVPPTGSYSTVVLRVDRTGQLFDAIRDLPQEPVPLPLNCHLAHNGRTSCFGPVERDKWDVPLRAVLSGDLAALASHPHVVSNPNNRAAWAYVSALPLGTRIALYWS